MEEDASVSTRAPLAPYTDYQTWVLGSSVYKPIGVGSYVYAVDNRFIKDPDFQSGDERLIQEV